MNADDTANPFVTQLESRLRLKTKDVCLILSCNEKTLRNWEKVCPKLFCPVLRQKNGNVYRPKQVRIMAEVMDDLMEPETGAELWERTITLVLNPTSFSGVRNTSFSAKTALKDAP